MKLLNQSILFISVSLLIIIGFWSVIFYYNIISEVKESTDDGLDNYKRQIIFQAHQDTALLKQANFKEGFYAVSEIPREIALSVKDRYSDTMMFVPKQSGGEDLEPFRLLTTAFEDDGRYYQLRVINSMVEKDDLVAQVFKNTVLLYILLIVSIVSINNLILRQVWKPFYRLLEKLKKYRLGEKEDFPEVRTHTKEFQDLQNAVHTLLRHNKATFEQQKQFIGNASHELQTPLAIALNRLELLVERGDLKEEQMADIEDIMNIIERLIRLNRSLLLLTKIENRQFLNNKEISLNRVVENGIEELKEVAEFRGLTFRKEESAEIKVEMDPALSEILISNLLRNAVFHSKKGSPVLITISDHQIEIRNEGEKALNPDTLFNRFEKFSGSSGGTGLGLAIVKAICDLYDLPVSYRFRNGEHRFLLSPKK